jgi:hypothetical protein
MRKIALFYGLSQARVLRPSAAAAAVLLLSLSLSLSLSDSQMQGFYRNPKIGLWRTLNICCG